MKISNPEVIFSSEKQTTEMEYIIIVINNLTFYYKERQN